MGNINDRQFRKMLVERFLDCDTSVEEERELASFYKECIHNGHVPEGEEDICQLIAATVGCHADKEAFDATPEQPIDATDARRPGRRPWQWMAAACVVGIIMVGAVLTLATHQDDTPTLADADTSVVRPTYTTDMGEATNADLPATPSKADTPDTPPDAGTSMPTMATRKKPAAATRRQKQPTTPTSTNISNICHAAMDAFHDATDISIERKGNALLLSTATYDGTCRRYVVNENGNGQVTLIEI